MFQTYLNWKTAKKGFGIIDDFACMESLNINYQKFYFWVDSHAKKIYIYIYG